MFKNPGYMIFEDPADTSVNESYYMNPNTLIGVRFKDQSVADILYTCKGGYDDTSVNGVSCNGVGDSIFDRYGKEVRVLCMKDKKDKDYLNQRVYDVVNYGIRHHVHSNKVHTFQIVAPYRLKEYIGINWTVCE